MYVKKKKREKESELSNIKNELKNISVLIKWVLCIFDF